MQGNLQFNIHVVQFKGTESKVNLSPYYYNKILKSRPRSPIHILLLTLYFLRLIFPVLSSTSSRKSTCYKYVGRGDSTSFEDSLVALYEHALTAQRLFRTSHPAVSTSLLISSIFNFLSFIIIDLTLI